MSVRRRLKAALFSLVRPLFVRGVDPREDYECVYCGEPVLRRQMTCSSPECARKWDS